MIPHIDVGIELIYVFGVVATFIMVFGIEGSGYFRRTLGSFCGLAWMVTIVYVFYRFPFKDGVVYLFGTLFLAAMLQKILHPFFHPHGRDIY